MDFGQAVQAETLDIFTIGKLPELVVCLKITQSYGHGVSACIDLNLTLTDGVNGRNVFGQWDRDHRVHRG